MFKARKARAANAEHKHAHRIPREVQHLANAAERTDPVNVIVVDFVLAHIFLRRKKNKALLFRCHGERLHASLPARIKMQQFAREHHKPPQRNERDMFINRIVSFHGHHSFFLPDASGIGVIQLYI